MMSTGEPAAHASPVAPSALAAPGPVVVRATPTWPVVRAKAVRRVPRPSARAARPRAGCPKSRSASHSARLCTPGQAEHDLDVVPFQFLDDQLCAGAHGAAGLQSTGPACKGRVPCPRLFPPSASVVVIGGGVIGTSILFHLAEAGVKDAGSARGGRSSAAGSHEQGRRRRARAVLGRAERPDRRSAASTRGRTSSARPGWEIDLKQVGYLFLLTRQEDVRHVRAQPSRSSSIRGRPESELIDVAEAARTVPARPPPTT